MEYAFAPDNSLDYLKLWSSLVRGHWHLAWEYWTTASALHGNGIHFEDGFRSQRLAETLEFIMQHQQTSLPSHNFGRTGLLQIQVPSEDESAAAAMLLSEALRRVNSISAQPSLA